MEPTPTIEPSYEDQANNPLEYPVEYFDAQIQFAVKWAELSGDGLEETLMFKTAIGRRLGFKDGVDQDGNDISGLLQGAQTAPEITSALYGRYILLDSSHYTETDLSSKGRKFFGFDYYPENKQNNGLNTIKVHYENNTRGAQSGLSRDLLLERQAEVKNMITGIVAEHPEAQEVIGGSWLYNLPAYAASFPPEFTDTMATLVPKELAEEYPDAVPQMAFSGNSVWGQFVDKRGWANKDRYDQLIEGIDAASSLAELYEAIPLKPLQPKAHPDAFINWEFAA